LKFLNRKTTGKDRLPRRHDAIIVLGAEIYADGRPSVALRRRVVHGVELLKSGAADRIVFSGGPKKGLPTEARVMRQLAVVQGVYDDQIILKEASQSTLGNALACSLICKNNEWLNVFLVTDAYHIWRAKILFRIHGINISASPPKAHELNPTTWRWWFLYAREAAALIWNILIYFCHLASPRS
jgi:uncharacterized SAM-binding protein YcdF (DUF218 family)